MKPIYVAGLLVLSLALTLLGMVLVGFNKIHRRNATRYTQLCTQLLLGAAYTMGTGDWPGLNLRQIDFWSLMVILAIVAYSLLWACIAYRLNTGPARGDFGESYMLSMLHTDSQQPPMDDFAQTRQIDRKHR